MLFKTEFLFEKTKEMASIYQNLRYSKPNDEDPLKNGRVVKEMNNTMVNNKNPF